MFFVFDVVVDVVVVVVAVVVVVFFSGTRSQRKPAPLVLEGQNAVPERLARRHGVPPPKGIQHSRQEFLPHKG